eukprot:gene17245-17070_t
MALLGAFDRENPKRWGNLAFWGLLAVSFLFGSYIGDLANGVLVLALAGLAGLSALGPGKANTTTPEERRMSAARLGAKLFIPALVIPLVTLAGTFVFKGWKVGALVVEALAIGGSPVVDPKQATLVSLILGVFVALAIAMPMLRERPAAPLQEGRRLLDTVGWAAVL